MRSLIFAVLAISACDAPEPFAPEADDSQSELIYGTDDRLDYYEVSDPDLIAMADATVALVDDGWLYRAGSGWRFYGSYSLAQTQGVCSTEPFADQPTVSSCSGVFIGGDLMATAGHCIPNQSTCNRTDFVFGYRKPGANATRTAFNLNDVYSCTQIVDRIDNGSADWAVIRVDRNVTGHTPADIRRSGTVSSGTPLVLSGHPSGLPMKIAPNASVRSNVFVDYFGANLDAFGGNSGSPVFNENTGEVEGILVRGYQDYGWNGSCYVSNVCPNNGCPGFAEVTRVTLFDHLVPDINGGGGGTPTPTCSDDAYENNDTVGAAATLVAGTYSLEMCGSGDDDWYEVSLVGGQSIDVTATFVHANGDIDMELWDGNRQIGVSQSTDDFEALSYTPTNSTTVQIRVYGYNNAENSYDLDVELGGTGLLLSGNPTVDAGDWYTFDIEGGPVNEQIYLVTGNANGSTAVPGCPGLSADVGGVIVVDQPFTDALGEARATVQVPASLGGNTYSFQAVSLDSCDTSNLFDLTIQ